MPELGTLRTLVVDDEAPARAWLRELLDAHVQVEIVAEAINGAEAIRAVLEHGPQLVFLDVRMPGRDGLAVARELLAATASGGIAAPAIVFVTAFEAHAVGAFDVRAVDYLLKPVDAGGVARALARVGERLAPTRAPASYLERVALRGREGQVVLQPVAAIERFVVEGKHLEAHVPRAPIRRIRRGIAALAARLDPARFVRVNRSELVNLEHVESLEPHVHGDWVLNLRSGAQVITTRRYRGAIVALLEG